MSRFRKIVEKILSENTNFSESGETDKNIIMFSYDTYKKMILYPFEDEYNKLVSKDPNAQINCKQSIYNINTFTKYISYCDSTLTVQFVISNDYDFRGKFIVKNDKKTIIMCLNNIVRINDHITFKSYDEALISIETWKAVLTQKEVLSVFVHEFQHFIDFCRERKPKFNYAKQKDKISPEKYVSMYANSPDETNAHIIQKMFDLTHEISDKYAKDEDGLNKKKASDFINYYLKNSGWKNDPHFLEYYNLLSDNNKRSVIKRLYSFFTEFFDE